MKAITTKSNKTRIIYKVISIALSTVFWTVLWAFCAKAVGITLVLPSPIDVLMSFKVLTNDSVFLPSVFGSILRIFKGYLIGVMSGTLFAILTFAFKTANSLLAIPQYIIKATPVASFIMLAWLWLDGSEVPVFISALMVTPIVWSSLKTAIESTDRQLLEFADIYKLSLWRKIKLIYFPSVLPAYLSSIVTSLGLSWKAGIAAEVLCQTNNSIGSGIYKSKLYLETPELFAWTLTVIILSVIMESLLKLCVSMIKRKGGSL